MTVYKWRCEQDFEDPVATWWRRPRNHCTPPSWFRHAETLYSKNRSSRDHVGVTYTLNSQVAPWTSIHADVSTNWFLSTNSR
jgi:hypothetical protein